jgi:DNA sulfur modification protein DndC
MKLSNGKINKSISRAIIRISESYQMDDSPWIVGYSGGKDSTAVLKILFHALLNIKNYHKNVNIIYSNTGVEIPCVAELVMKVLKDFQKECRYNNLPISVNIIKPEISERYFVKIIGRGYPPPTDKFRWCTDRLLIQPLNQFLEISDFKDETIVLGVRQNESATRNLTLKENKDGKYFFRKQKGYASRKLFMPILDFNINDVWDANLLIKEPKSLRGEELADLYANASDQPMVRSTYGAPNGKARFGCWPCTVAKHGITLRNLINSGNKNLIPLLEYRLWLESERNKPINRWKKRRNRQPGPGPMTITWRRKALKRLINTQIKTGFELIENNEIDEIKNTWGKE